MRIELSWLIGIDQRLHVVTIRIHWISLLLNERLLHHDGLHMLLLVLLQVHHLLLLHAGLRSSHLVIVVRRSLVFPTAATANVDDKAQEDDSEDAEESIEHRLRKSRAIALSLSSTDTLKNIFIINGAVEWAFSDWDLAIGTIRHSSPRGPSVGQRALIVVVVVAVVVAVAIIVLTVCPVVVACGSRLGDHGKRGHNLNKRSHISKK